MNITKPSIKYEVFCKPKATPARIPNSHQVTETNKNVFGETMQAHLGDQFSKIITKHTFQNNIVNYHKLNTF